MLLNNPRNRQELCLSVSRDGASFHKTAILRDDPPPLRLAGHDKSPSWTYPHAVEHEGKLYVIYAANRDDIVLTQVAIAQLRERLLPKSPHTP